MTHDIRHVLLAGLLVALAPAAGRPASGIGGLQSGSPFKRQEGSVLGAILYCRPPLGVVDPDPNTLIASIRYQFLNMAAGGSVYVDFFGLDSSTGSLKILYNSS